MTRIFLASFEDCHYVLESIKPKYVLESFYYIKETSKVMEYVNRSECKMFLLDSGAFTFMNNTKGEVNFDNYLTKYINFINKHDIKYFFELDIDSVVGYAKVKEMRKRLEKETGKKCIPVWHKPRGLDDWKEITQEYDYVSIGGIVTKEISKKDYKIFTPLLNIAHENHCKVHGLGFTAIKELDKYNFDTVDSTSWKSGARFGSVYLFKDNELKTVKKPKNARLKLHYKDINIHNAKQWLKFIEKIEKGK